ncbi:small subunit processome component 20 homolog [Maniola hyperantus]|uniref:small subunit processome component 20 homolog n=1 Tax=Aphantopus hyperantus TaxID=2795564 RepID=UPI001568CE8D|nr:small subunit processome component 20 homolog [Maniola hyperantus]
MKSKPVKHKTTNTFRFVSFAERINAIDIRHAALYHIEHVYANQPNENESHFHLALQKWHGLNLTENFKKFKKEVYGIVTVPQLIHKKDEVLQLLEKYLKLEDQLCLQPLLEILVSLAKDLRIDFYPHFPKFLDILIDLLNTKDAERLEWTLVCLAFLFKTLKPFLKKDIGVVLTRIIPLLSDAHPQYINNFAAESFAFVARDIRDKKKFIELVLNYLQTNDNAITGCGHLIFEIVRGVSNKFHSCIESTLPVLLQHLKEKKEHQQILFKVLTQTFEDCLQAISAKEFSIFWKSIQTYTEEILKEDENNKGLEYILRLAGQVVEHQHGKYLTNPPQFALLLVRIICEQSSETVLEVCSQIGALMLLSKNISLSQEHAGIIVKVLLPLPYPNILINFVQNVIHYSQFDMHILPAFIKFVIQSDFDSDAMTTLSKICLTKSPLSKSGLKLFEWVKYPIDFGKDLPKLMEHVENVLNTDLEDIVEGPNKLMNLLFCLPHVEKLDVDFCIKKLSELVSKFLKILTSYNLEGEVNESIFHCDVTPLSKCARKIMFLLANSLECAIHISSCSRLKAICDIETLLPIILPCAADPNYIVALNLLDLYLTAYEHENGLTYPFLSLVDSYLTPNVSSPFHIVRLLTTHIYKLFENVEELNKTVQVGGETERFSVFSKCFTVESISPSIQEYRLQLNLLQKMAFNTIQYELAKDTDFHLYALNYMLGILYVNFKLLWEPVVEFIAGYGNALNADDFWPTFYKALESSFANAKNDLKIFIFEDDIETDSKILKDLYIEYTSIAERPDVHNYRNLILKTMTNCIQVCEAKNRDVVVLFLKFIEEEYRRNDTGSALKVDIEAHNKAQMEIENTQEKPAEVIEELIEEIPEEDTPKDSVSGKMIFKTLINIMQVLSQFKNPRALHKEPVFWELYMDFLKNKNPGLQKYALDCVLNYKNKSVTPYKANLHNLVDENKFKDELTQFKITEDSQTIQPEHREHVIPIVLRVLYGKMTSKLGADKKGGGQARRSLVMRYLSGCNENEQKMFIQMAFSYVQDFMAMEPKELYTEIFNNVNLKSVTSAGKLHSILNLFDVVREYFGGYMGAELLSQFFKIFYAVCCNLASVLVQIEKVHVGYVKAIKNIRVLAINILAKLFDHFEKYEWSKDELFVIFQTLIFPLVTRLHIEGIHSPTALLKLFNIWCQNPRYYALLITCSEEDNSVSALPAIFKLLLAPKTTSGVVNMILDMIEKLLTLIEDEEEKDTPKIESYCTLEISANDRNDINFGSKILIPHLPSILEVMKRRIANSAKSNTVNRRDLLILSRVTEMVTTPEMCDDLLNLLLPILVKKVCMNMAEENMEHAVHTIINLLGHSTNPQHYVKNVAVLFNKVGPVEVRKLLIKLLSSIAENAKKNKEVLRKLAHVIAEMNAFNKRWIEQPDFDRRLDAYKLIYQMLDADEIDVDLAILIVNNCFYFIRTEKDIGLRDSAGLCLKKILPRLLLKYRSTPDGQFLVRDTVLSLISTGIRDSKNDLLRNESIMLLGELVRECSDADVVLSDLAPLANKEDREVDFFDNSCHLQLHRRVRALLKFSKVARKMTKCPTPRTLTNFILPLATIYICDDKYSDKNTLIDACIEVISTCCRLLPWYHYEVILKLYLNKLRYTSEHQKQLTRILIGILDAFHFDFSKAKNIELPKLLTANIRKEKKNVAKKEKNDEKSVDTKTDNPDSADDSEEEPEDISNKVKNEEQIQEMENELLAAEDVVEEQTSKEVADLPAYERITSVSPSVANRIIKSLSSGLLPQLNRSIGKLTEHEGSHKLNRRPTSVARLEEDMLRVPIALALVKLLQRLPGDILKHQLPGIIIKLCSFLKSPLKQIRSAARDIVKKIMLTVGTSYLGILLEHLTILLTRGFQVHVLVATIHTVLDALKSDFKSGEINENLHYILNVCANDLFGSLSEEKEVDKLHYKTPEAKPSKKSYVTLMIVAQNITEKCLINLLLPFKEVLQKHHSKKIVLKIQEALMHISSGLVTNKFIAIEDLFVFLHGLASESIPEFVLTAPKRELTEAQREKILRAKPDCFIIPETPKRNKESQAKNVKTSSKTNAHVLVEFSLNILYVILKREKVPRMDCKAFVDPIIPLLVDALKSDHIKVSTVALKCIATLWTVRISTPSLEEMVKDIVKTIFSILHKYATFEISTQNDNYHLVRNAFKAVTVLVRNVRYYNLEADQLKTLLLYAEEDCQNDEKQANSFSLLKAILDAKLVSPELHEVMEKVSRICILSESARSRDEARAIFVSYLTHYSPGKQLGKHIQFFVTQLNYELQHGRESSLKFLDMIINKLNVAQLKNHGDYLFLSLGACMINDSAPECREAAANCIEAMLKKFPLLERNKLFDLVLAFFNDTQPVHFELAAQLSIRFVNVEQEEFQNRLNNILSLVSGKILLLNNDIAEGRFVKIQLEHGDKTDEEQQKEKDHSLIQILNLIDKITIHCLDSLKNKKFVSDYDELAQQCQVLLAYPHAWVRLRSAKILGTIISQVNIEELNVKEKDSDRGFIYYDTENSLRSLILDLCAQYTPNVTKDMADQVTAVLFQILKLVHAIPCFALSNKLQTEDRDEDRNAKVNIRWILFKLRKAINVEVAKAPNSMFIRTAIFTMWLHVISSLDTTDINRIVDVILPAIVRELSTGDGPSSAAKQLAGRLGKKLRRKIGEIEYGKMAAEVQTKLNIKRAERKKMLLQEKVNNPEKAAKRKLQVREKKKQAKKIKLEMMHGKRPRAKKRKAEDIDFEEDLFKDTEE